MRMQPSPPRIPRWALYGGTCALTMAVTAWVQLSGQRDVVTLAQPSSVAAPVPTTQVPRLPLKPAAPSVMPPTQGLPPTVLPHAQPSGTTAASPVIGANGFAQPAPEAPPADPDSERAGN